MDAGFGIYVHWPFCAAKCPYCDFNSHVRHGGIDQARYAAAFVRELAHAAEGFEGRRVDSVFFGGGTPSLMAPETVDAILGAIGRQFALADDAEITLEANPTSVEAGRFAAYRSSGVNRVSLGVQALNDTDLKTLGRLHTAAEALDAVDIANRTFDRVSFDMIYARPGQTVAAWEGELTRALAFGPSHLSLYQLTIEPETPFGALHRAGRLVVPDADTGADLYRVTQELTAAAGLPAYEVSNHARPGQESRHNLIYWRCGDFLGIGPGAYGRYGTGQGRIETTRLRSPEEWLNAVEAHGHGTAALRHVGRGEAGDEILMMGLRLTEGIDLDRHAAIAGRPVDPDRIADLQALELVERTGGRLVVTDKGRPVLNRIVVELSGE